MYIDHWVFIIRNVLRDSNLMDLWPPLHSFLKYCKVFCSYKLKIIAFLFSISSLLCIHTWHPIHGVTLLNLQIQTLGSCWWNGMKRDTEVWVSVFAFRASLAVSISSKIKMKTLDSHRDTREEVLHLMFLPRGSNCKKHLSLDSFLF